MYLLMFTFADQIAILGEATLESQLTHFISNIVTNYRLNVQMNPFLSL